MNPAFNIRKASIKDISLIRELTFKVWPQTYAGILSRQQIDFMLDMMYSESSLLQQMEEGADFYLVAVHHAPIGFASVQEMKSGIYKLHKLYILPIEQNKGAGRFVLDHIIHTIRIKGAVSLQLQVNRFNKAKDFYQKLGFSIIEEADFDIGGGYFMNDYVMELKLE